MGSKEGVAHGGMFDKVASNGKQQPMSVGFPKNIDNFGKILL